MYTKQNWDIFILQQGRQVELLYLISLLLQSLWNPSEVWETSGQILSTKSLIFYSKRLYDCFKFFFLQEIISNNTKCGKQILNFIWNKGMTDWLTLKYWWNETDNGSLPVFAQFTWTLNFVFSSSQWEIVFGVISGNYLYLELLKNTKRTAIYWKLFLYKILVHEKLKLLNLLMDFIYMWSISSINQFVEREREFQMHKCLTKSESWYNLHCWQNVPLLSGVHIPSICNTG